MKMNFKEIKKPVKVMNTSKVNIRRKVLQKNTLERVVIASDQDFD